MAQAMCSDSLAWAAGLFEGEGTICTYHDGRKGNYRPRIIRLSMTDEDVVRRFHAIVGGRMEGPHPNGHYPDGRPYQVIWRCAANGDTALSILRQMLPYLGKRRRAKALEVFPELLNPELNFDESLGYLNDIAEITTSMRE